ncbi:MAG: N-acetyltransferase [Thaumarchaeota archaeon]|nr:N-acetyltransferase [Nitrososphaerota archaeon]
MPVADTPQYQVIHPTAKIGRNVKIWHLVYIGAGTVVGDGTSIGTLVQIDREVRIGRDCRIQGNVYISSKSVIGDRVFIGPGTVFLNDMYPPSGGHWEPPVVEDNVIIGGGCVILPGVTIGEGAVIGAHSTVTRDVNGDSMVLGTPARPYISRNEYEARKKQYIKGLEEKKS